jgi:hypothetical protein
VKQKLSNDMNTENRNTALFMEEEAETPGKGETRKRKELASSPKHWKTTKESLD